MNLAGLMDQALGETEYHAVDLADWANFHADDLTRLYPDMSPEVERSFLAALYEADPAELPEQSLAMRGLGMVLRPFESHYEPAEVITPLSMQSRRSGVVTIDWKRGVNVSIEQRRYAGHIMVGGESYMFGDDASVYTATARYIGRGTFLEPQALLQCHYMPSNGRHDRQFQSKDELLPDAHAVFRYPELTIEPYFHNGQMIRAITNAVISGRAASDEALMQLPADRSGY